MSVTKAERMVDEEAPHARGKMSNLTFKALDRFITFVAVIVLFILFSFVAPNFFTIRSILSLALQTSAVTMMGIGVTFTIITGGVDLLHRIGCRPFRYDRRDGCACRSPDLA